MITMPEKYALVALAQQVSQVGWELESAGNVQVLVDQRVLRFQALQGDVGHRPVQIAKLFHLTLDQNGSLPWRTHFNEYSETYEMTIVFNKRTKRFITYPTLKVIFYTTLFLAKQL